MKRRNHLMFMYISGGIFNYPHIIYTALALYSDCT